MVKRPEAEGERSLDDLVFLLGQMSADIQNIERTMTSADASRKGIHEKLENLTLRMTYVERDTHSITERTNAIEKVTSDVESMRAKALGAGMVGRGLLTLGGWLLSAVLAAITLWNAFLGRPPP